MKIKFLTFLLLFSIVSLAQSVPSVAVLDFDTRGYNEVERYQIIQKLSLEMINMDGYEVMDNYDIEYISNRDEIDFTGCFSRICLKELGEKFDVNFILTGSMNLLGEKVSTTVRLFDVNKGSFINSANRNYVDVPKNDLLMKVVIGDKGDYVPSIDDKHGYKPEFLEWCVNENVADNQDALQVKFKHDENLVVEHELKFLDKYGIKAARVSTFPPKLATSLINEGKLLEHINKKENEKLKEKFVRNNKLVNLTAQPKKLKEQIINSYSDYELKAGLNKLFDFFIMNGFNQFMEDTVRIGNMLEPLTSPST